VEDMHISNGDTLMNKVKVDLNMLDTLILDGVGGEVDRANVIIVDQSGPR
jgi:hypothetical protein